MTKKEGFTLIEVVVVTLIIAALALLVAPSFKNSTLTNQMEKAKIGLVELTTAVKLYNEVHSTTLSGTFNNDMFNTLTQEDTAQGYVYLQNSGRWGLRTATDYSLYDGNSILNCKYIIGQGTDDIVASAKCEFDEVDGDGTECYQFYIERTNPAVVKKQILDGDSDCNDL